jgi:beta-glucosidase
VSEVVRPMKELKAFKRVKIKAKERVTVEFALSEKNLRYYHNNGDCKADEGQFEIFVGKDSNTVNKIRFHYQEI